MSKVFTHSILTDLDIHLFRQGKHYELYKKLGSHLMEVEGTAGVYFAVWAPNASEVSVIGDFNYWQKGEYQLHVRWDGSGIWEGFIPNLSAGTLYKFAITNTHSGQVLEKYDPFAKYCEEPPSTASVIYEPTLSWSDQDWQKQDKDHYSSPVSIYEVHLGSWQRTLENEMLSCRDLADKLVSYLVETGFTHVEFMPISEHPFYGSWGYQTLGYFAPTARYGTPEDFGYLINELHKNQIGVILDWVPSHFPNDEWGLARYDGTHLYEHEDPRKGFHPDWKSCIFNYGRNEVQSFLISSALFWLDVYHLDGLRVDGVASMLYLDYSREAGQWEPNVFGGNENLEAIHFLKEFNQAVYSKFPQTLTIAEESTAWNKVSKPVYEGGLGFGMKWMMGWMHDALSYFTRDCIHRKYHQHELTFSMHYYYHENFVLPLSHDEVVHGKGSLIENMPGDLWQKFANLRVLYAYMFLHPGHPMLFMGSEFAQFDEWNHDKSLDWHLLDFEHHRGILSLVKELNRLLKAEPAMYVNNYNTSGFEWIDYSDSESSVFAFLRKSNDPSENLYVFINGTPEVRHYYGLGVESAGDYEEIFNSDLRNYGGSHLLNGTISTQEVSCHGRPCSISITLPPLALIVFKKIKNDAQ